MIFFHALSVGFFVDEIHGPRTIFVPDPDWTRPLMSVPDPSWIPPEDDAEAIPPLIEMPDMEAVAPLIEVENPACTLPARSELVEVDEADYIALLDAQTHGREIQATPEGQPVAVEPPPLDQAELETRERRWRDSALNATDGAVVRHRDELEADRETTLSADQYRELQAYRMELRDWPQAEQFPDTEARPLPPAWLADRL